MFSPRRAATSVLSLPTGLRDITALAYSPNGDLYAADFAADQADGGGVYRLEAAQVDGRESCRARQDRRASNDRTALAFTPDGASTSRRSATRQIGRSPTRSRRRC